MRLLRRLFAYLRPYKTAYAVAVVCMMLTALCNLVPPYATKFLVDDVIIKSRYPLLLPLALGLVGIYLVKGALSYGSEYLSHLVSENVQFDMRAELYEQVQTLSTGFYKDERTGEVMSRVVNHVEALRDMVAHSASTIITDGLTFTGITIILLLMDWRLTLLTLVPVPLLALLSWKLGNQIRKSYRAGRDKLGEINAYLQDAIAGMEVIRAFAREDHEQQRFRGHAGEYRSWMIEFSATSAKYWPMIEILIGVGSIIVLSYGGYQVMHGALTLGGLVAFNSYIWRLYFPVTELARENERLQRALAAAERIFEFRDLEPEVTEAPHAVSLDTVRAALEFADVTFEYRTPDLLRFRLAPRGSDTAHSERAEPPASEPVLRGLSFRLEPGEVVGLVGPSGIGKTTIAALILRLYDPTEGRVLLDGHELQDLKLKWLRDQIGIVHQDTFLFNATLRENIAYGKLDATQAEIEAAARAGNIYDFILGLPKGFETVVGERGVKLSGGQKQRVAIARALLKNPPVLLLDEATSSVDTESEQLIQQSLAQLLQGRTTLIIAHRLATLQFANRILVLDGGRIAETGSHSELIERNGLYRKLYDAQFAGLDGFINGGPGERA